MSDGPMWRFLKRRVIKEGDFSPKHADNSDEVNDEESQASDKFHCTSATNDTQKVRLYNESYLSMCFTLTGDSSCPIPGMSNASIAGRFLVYLKGLYGNYTCKACKFTCSII
jgi:hypothetical protein